MIDIHVIKYHQTSNISCTLVGNKIVDHSHVVGASPVGAAPTKFSFSTKHRASMDWTKTTARWEEKRLSFEIWCVLYQRFDGIQIDLWWWLNGQKEEYFNEMIYLCYHSTINAEKK